MRNRMVRLRVSDEDVATMKDLAKARGMSLSDMIRRSALSVRMPSRTFDHTHAVLLGRMLGELGRVGGNINQLARRANAGKLEGYERQLSNTIAEIDMLRSRIRELIR